MASQLMTIAIMHQFRNINVALSQWVATRRTASSFYWQHASSAWNSTTKSFIVCFYCPLRTIKLIHTAWVNIVRKPKRQMGWSYVKRYLHNGARHWQAGLYTGIVRVDTLLLSWCFCYVPNIAEVFHYDFVIIMCSSIEEVMPHHTVWWPRFRIKIR